MIEGLQGVVLCAGNAGRFAESVGKPTPYPKHLERIGDQTILSRVVEGLVKNVPVTGITFTLNPQLKALYLEHLLAAQQIYPEIPFSYTSDLAQGESLSALSQLFNRQVYDLSKQEVPFDHELLAATFGDAVVEPGNSRLRQDVETNLSNLELGKNIVVGKIGFFSGIRIYHLSSVYRLHNLDANILLKLNDYGLKAWNINTYEELIEARQALGDQSLETG